MKFKFIFIFIFTATSCSKDYIPIDDTEKLLGNYSMITLTSDFELDLNHDGTPTTDFKTELSSFYDFYLYPPLRIKKSSSNIYILEVIVPKSQFWPEFNDFNVVYVSRGDAIYIKYVENLNSISFDRTQESYDFQIQNEAPIITNVIKSNDFLIVNIKQKFYSHPDGWFNVNLIGKYQLIK